MKINRKLLAIPSVAAFVAAVLFLIFHARSPVLILAEQSFLSFYGEDRIKQESFYASLSLFRPVKTVVVASDAGDDLVQYAIENISSRPYYVLFPLRFARSAEIYHGQNPDIRIILLEGRIPQRDDRSDRQAGFFIYRTDLESDFFRAGIASAALDNENSGKTALFIEPHVLQQAREAFFLAFEGQEKQPEAYFFTSFSAFSGIQDLSCVVMAGNGYEYLNEKSGVPVILFSWLNPFLAPSDVVLIVNDSPWVQAVRAVKLADTGEMTGNIPSKFLAADKNKVNRGLLRRIQFDH